MTPEKVAEAIIKEKVSEGLTYTKLTVFALTTLSWLTLVYLINADTETGLFLIAIRVLTLVTSFMSLEILLDKRAVDFIRRRIENRLRMKFHWF